MSEILVSFLVLDYRKPLETRLCLESIKRNALFPHKVVYLDNGGYDETYPDVFYKEGLCDVIIRKRDGGGGGFGQTDLFRWCDTKYAIFVQSDQVLAHKIDEQTLEFFIKTLDYANCVDLNGDQSNRGVWTDRAHLIDVAFFNSLGPFPNGGPGPNHELPWNEKYLQDQFWANDYKIANIKPTFFSDIGIWTIRELPCGGLLKMRTDTKQVYWEKLPKQKYVFPEMNDKEWELSVGGEWVNGTVPEKYLLDNASFHCWDGLIEKMGALA